MPKTRIASKKRHDPAKYNRPWTELARRVRQLPHYELPHPYQRAKIWHPGDNHPSKSSITGERRIPERGVPPIQTMILPSDSGHHPYGPSMIESFSPQAGGCGNYQPHGGTHPLAEVGTLQHSVTVDGNFERLGGIERMEEEVRWARAQIAELYEAGFKDEKYGGREDRKFDGEEYIETCFGIPGLNFGTIDRLRFSADGTRAIVIDLKFGAWPVTPPHSGPGRCGNLQLLNYAVFAFFLRRPMPHSVTVALVHVKSRTVETYIYRRRSVYLMKARIAKIIERAERGKTDPASIGYYPNPSNCSWCERINCPARLDLASSIVSLWRKEPIVLPRPELLTISIEQLALLKSFVNALQRLIDAVNEECKRRAFDNDELIPGYEIKQRSGKRRIVGVANISEACNLVTKEWPKWFNTPLDLAAIALEKSELGVDDIEQAAGKAAPKGKILRARELVAQLLNNPSLVQNSVVYYLAMQIPKIKES